MSDQQQMKVSRAMVAAGVRVLRASGFLLTESSADDLLVRRILDTALRARTEVRRRCKDEPSKRETRLSNREAAIRSLQSPPSPEGTA